MIDKVNTAKEQVARSAPPRLATLTNEQAQMLAWQTYRDTSVWADHPQEAFKAGWAAAQLRATILADHGADIITTQDQVDGFMMMPLPTGDFELVTAPAAPVRTNLETPEDVIERINASAKPKKPKK